MSDSNLAPDGRTCSSCGKQKSWDSFDKKKSGPNGHHSRCKVCIGKQKKIWWKRKNMKRRVHPNIFEFTSSDIIEKGLAFNSTEKLELEKVLRMLVVDTLIKERTS